LLKRRARASIRVEVRSRYSLSDHCIGSQRVDYEQQYVGPSQER
jgi:hypothetical protein